MIEASLDGRSGTCLWISTAVVVTSIMVGAVSSIASDLDLASKPSATKNLEDFGLVPIVLVGINTA